MSKSAKYFSIPASVLKVGVVTVVPDIKKMDGSDVSHMLNRNFKRTWDWIFLFLGPPGHFEDLLLNVYFFVS